MSRATLLIAVLVGVAAATVLAANLGTGSTPSHAKGVLSSQRPISSAQPGGISPSPRAIENGLRAVVGAVRPAVVSIAAPIDSLERTRHAGMQLLTPYRTQTTAVGTGVIVDQRGHILTSRQVTGNAEHIRVTMFRSGENNFPARRVAVDPHTNLVLFQLPFAGGLPFAHLGDSSRVRAGDIVIAVGSPFGLAETVTQGIVSARKRQISVQGLGPMAVIQTDAAINQGNCGGPLVSIDAQVVGINAAIYSTDSTFSGIGFAIPINQARAFYRRAVGALP